MGVLSVDSGGTSTGLINQPVAPLVVRLKDQGGAPLEGRKVHIQAPPGAIAEPAEATTSSLGKVTFQLRLGRAVGEHEFVVTEDSSPSLSVKLAASEPAPGTVIPILNATASEGDYLGVTAATGAGPLQITAIAAAKDGTLFASPGGLYVFRVTPAGVWERVAGDPAKTPQNGSSGDGGLAKDATFNTIFDFALDEANQKLYLADFQGSNKVLLRTIDLVSGEIDLLGGGGSADGPGYGDGGPATQAQVLHGASGVRLHLGPGNKLHLKDGSQRYRQIDLTNKVISTWLASGNVNGDTLRFCDLSSGTGAIFDASGDAFFITPTTTPPDNCAGGGGTVIQATSSVFSPLTLLVTSGKPLAAEGKASDAGARDSSDLILDGAGNLFAAAVSGVYRIDKATKMLTHVMGDFSQAAITGSFGPGKDAQAAPIRLSVDGAGTIYVLETSTVRALWKAAAPPL